MTEKQTWEVTNYSIKRENDRLKMGTVGKRGDWGSYILQCKTKEELKQLSLPQVYRLTCGLLLGGSSPMSNDHASFCPL
jgi:hypothetical protein